jgi:hypothetical protein
VVGLETSKRKARELIESAIVDLRRLPVQGGVLEALALYICTRIH